MLMKTILLFALSIPLAAIAAPEPLKEASQWIHGVPAGQACVQLLQVHQAGPGVFIIRQNKCVNTEAPFLYLILGEQKALLLDSGAKPDAGVDFPLVETVNRLIGERKLSLLVAHTHGHRDHIAFDYAFRARANTTVVGTTPDAVKTHFQFTQWPEGEAQVDLGGRKITVLPLPGHEAAHLAFYDPHSGTVFSGDSLYPGMLTVRDWPAYRQSIARLLKFAEAHPVTAFAGAHVEMMSKPYDMYPLDTAYQPQEHKLFLGLEHLRQLNDALTAQGEKPARIERADFIVEPYAPPSAGLVLGLMPWWKRRI
ncbi:MBL fold metallo-hydrolase [Pseudoduganella violaceinigra]|uniref:MBL fold metallo-hydrolase n=1 Tax=Pseudoduganella violaceinigra TaxID=246602 RepID=UPI0006891151|nr:MBL fold metallo-hydrolase [Pseudoduganella violaceinigra]